MCETAASVASSLGGIQPWCCSRLHASDFCKSFPHCCLKSQMTPRQSLLSTAMPQAGTDLLQSSPCHFFLRLSPVSFPSANSRQVFCLCVLVNSQSIYRCIQNFQMVAQLVPLVALCFPLLSGTVVFFPSSNASVQASQLEILFCCF